MLLGVAGEGRVRDLVVVGEVDARLAGDGLLVVLVRHVDVGIWQKAGRVRTCMEFAVGGK